MPAPLTRGRNRLSSQSLPRHGWCLPATMMSAVHYITLHYIQLTNTHLDLSQPRHRDSLEDHLRYTVFWLDYSSVHETRAKSTLEVDIRMIEQQDHHWSPIVGINDSRPSLYRVLGSCTCQCTFRNSRPLRSPRPLRGAILP